MPTPQLLRRSRYVLLALGSFALVASGLRTLVPWPTEYGMRAKYLWLAEHPARYDTLFIGTSVTAYGLVPQVFDEVMARRGHPLRSFNFGIGGMATLEADHTLRRLLELDLSELKYVFVEAGGWDPRIYAARNTYTPRMLFWHSPGQTAIALGCVRNLLRSAPITDLRALVLALTRLELGVTHLELALRRFANVGLGFEAAGALAGDDRAGLRPTRSELEALDGYVDLDVIEGQEWERRRAGFLAQLPRYRSQRDRIPRRNQAATDVTGHLNPSALEQQQRLIRAAGARPVYYTGPRLAASPMNYAMARAGRLPVFLGFNQPDLYPELYAEDRRFDNNHLNRLGSEEFSRALAHAFADYLDEESE